MFVPLEADRRPSLRPHNSNISQSDWDVLADFWHPIAIATDVQDSPVTAQLLDVSLVLFRGSEGAVAVALDMCPHRQIRLSSGKVIDGEIVCPFHGMRFDTSGRCTLIPALGGRRSLPANYRVATFPSIERYGLIWVCLGQADRHEPPDFPALNGVPVAELDFLGPQSWPVSAPRQIENFFDLAHLPLVHADTIGGDATAAMKPGSVEQRDDAVMLKVHYVETAPGLPPRPCEFIYRIVVPFAIDFHIVDATPNQMHAYNIPSPTSAHVSRVFQIFRVTDGDRNPAAEMQKGFKTVFSAVNQQDIDVLSALAAPDMPLDQHHEIHLPVDNICAAYRLRLREMGLGRTDRG